VIELQASRTGDRSGKECAAFNCTSRKAVEWGARRRQTASDTEHTKRIRVHQESVLDLERKGKSMRFLHHIWPWSRIRQLEETAQLLKSALMVDHYRDQIDLLNEFQSYITRSWTSEDVDAALDAFIEWRKERKAAEHA
jgi:hypothetical protein